MLMPLNKLTLENFIGEKKSIYVPDGNGSGGSIQAYIIQIIKTATPYSPHIGTLCPHPTRMYPFIPKRLYGQNTRF